MSNIRKSDKRLRFEKVAAKRVEKIVHYLNLLGNCSNKSNYEYTKKDVDKMFKEIQSALNRNKTKFEIELSKNKNKFEF